MEPLETRGILNPLTGLARFSLERDPPPADLAGVVQRFWRVSWELDGQPPFEQEVLPYPCVNVSFGPAGFEVHGPSTARFVAKLSGRGRVFGVKFTPAGFFAFTRVPMRTLVDRVVPLDAATGCAAPEPADDEPDTVRAAIEAFLRGFARDSDADIARVDRLVELAQRDRRITRAEQLADVAGVSVRSLHRLFERHVGVSPKWIVRRSRVQEIAERAARDANLDWAQIAQELGYYDQAHLIRDFRAQVGFSPASYARRCARSS